MIHFKSKHEGVKYPCYQCDYKATQKGNLLTHLKSKHEGVKYPCDQCDYKATEKGNLLRHLKSKHEGFIFPCSQCEYKATLKSGLLRHFNSKHKKCQIFLRSVWLWNIPQVYKQLKLVHKGVKYPCDQETHCDLSKYWIYLLS